MITSHFGPCYPSSPPHREQVAIAIQRLKFNNASGYELFKAGGNELVSCMHHLLCNIWPLQNMLSEWSRSLLCAVLKKGDAAICSNYRGISQLMIAYRILFIVLCERLKPFVNKLIGSYQCGFRPGKSSIYQIFTLRQILEKTGKEDRHTSPLRRF